MTNRAALTKSESYGWIHAVAGLYVVLVGGYAVSAWLSDHEPFRAIMCAGAQGLAIVCAILARRAFTGEMPLVGGLMVLFTLGCAAWSALGIKHAWEINGAEVHWLMVGFLAALEPLLFLAAEHIKEGREALRERFRRDETETREALEVARARDHGWGPRLAASAGATVAAMPAAANAAEIAPNWPTTDERPAIVTTNTGFADARSHALAMKRSDARLKEREAAERLGVPKSTVGHWWRKAGLTGAAEVAA
jgi:hypothetical protein